MEGGESVISYLDREDRVNLICVLKVTGYKPRHTHTRNYMKLFILLSLFAFSAFAQDMSRTETWENSYREESDGSSTYIGGCGTHQDYEGKTFTKGATIVKYFEPSQFTQVEIKKKLSKVDPVLVKTIEDGQDGYLEGVDDLTIEKLVSKKFAKLDLYLVNMGVGGGNGIIFVYNKTKTGYELMSQVMDGDVEFCDKKVWIK